MKLNTKSILRLGVAAGLYLLAAGSARAAVPVSPVGTWDCTISGAQGRGLAYITFNSDYTFTGYEVLTANPPKPAPETDTEGRNSGGDVGRGTDTNSVSLSAASASSSNLYGFSELEGPWTYDLTTGKVIGYFAQRVDDGTGTNSVVISIGFTAKMAAGPRLNMVTSTTVGKTHYTGKPVSPTFPDLTGTWYGFNKQNGAKMVEFFSLVPSGMPGLYLVSGDGAGYTYNGYALASGWKKVGFSFYTSYEGATTTGLRATVGSFYPQRMTAETSGVDSPDTRCKFNATWYQVPSFTY